MARRSPQPVQNFISDWVIDYNCGFIDSSSCGVSDYISARLLVSGAGLAGNTAIEGRMFDVTFNIHFPKRKR